MPLLAVHHEDVDQSIGVRMHAETGEIADLTRFLRGVLLRPSHVGTSTELSLLE